MNVFPANSFLKFGLPFVAALMIGGAALAQTATPTVAPNAPSTVEATDAPTIAPAPRRLKPRRLKPRNTVKPADTATPSSIMSSPSGFSVNTLASIDTDSVGALSQTESGFPADMWNGTPRVVVDALMPELPVYTTSMAVRDLMRKLLLSAATTPEGDAKPGALIAQRIETLAAMGDQAGVVGLLGAMPSRIDNEKLAWTETDARFLSSDNARACAVVGRYVARSDAVYWQKSFIFCQILAGQKEQARLSLDLLRDTVDDDPVFFQLADAMLAGTTLALDSLPDATPLNLAMARVAQVELPEDVVSSNKPGVLRTIAMSPKLPVAMRLEAAERAAASGALPVSALRQIYGSVPFSDEELANPLSVAQSETGPRSRALLYRAASRQKVPTARAEAVFRALELAREGGRFGPTARAFAPLIKGIPASTEYVWFAPDAIRAMLIGNEPEGAADWFRVLSSNANFREDSAMLHKRVVPLAYLARLTGTEIWSPDSLDAWLQTVAADEDASAQAETLFALYQAVGEPVPATLWAAALGGGKKAMVPMPRAALWLRATEAAEQGRLGETVLAALAVMGDGALADVDAVLLHHVVASLMKVGRIDEARALAVEAAIAKGL